MDTVKNSRKRCEGSHGYVFNVPGTMAMSESIKIAATDDDREC